MLIGVLSPQAIGQKSYTSRDNASGKQLKILDEAAEHVQFGRTSQALELINDLKRKSPDFIDVHMLEARCHETTQSYEEAIAAISTALQIDSTYRTANLLYMASLAERSMNYELGVTALEDYQRIEPEIKASDRQRIEERISLFVFRDSLVNNPVSFNPQQVPGMVNSPADEALPAFTVDGRRMIFTRYERRQEDIYTANWDEEAGEWKDVKQMSGVNSAANEGAPSISADGSAIAFTVCGRSGGSGGCDIYVARRNPDGTWQGAQSVPEINSSGWDGQPSFTPDGSGLFFSSEREGGLGKRDIWYAGFSFDEGWSAPVNCGSTINTPGNESSPFLTFDGKTLYFMSDEHMGMGDYDIFYSRVAGGAWSAPVNLGYPINTTLREGGLSVHPDGQMAYYTREEQRGGRMDLYQFELAESLRPERISFVAGLVTDKETGEVIQAEAVIYELTDPGNKRVYYSDKRGVFVGVIPHGSVYGVEVNAEGYVFYSDQFSLNEMAPYAQHDLRIELTRVSTIDSLETPIRLENILFATGEAVLLDGYVSELQRVVKFMNDHPEIRVIVQGHTDNVGDEQENLELSQARAEVVMNWIIDNGIDAGRLAARGYGEQNPVASNDDTEGRSLNRRTELVILR